MHAEQPVVKAFLGALRETLSTMAMLEVEVQETAPCERLGGSLDVSATLGLCGDREGLLVLSLDGGLAAQVVAAMLGVGEDEVGDDLCDGVGEVANMVAGSAKTALEEGDHRFSLSIPATIEGAKHEVTPSTRTPGVLARCSVEGRPLVMALWMHGIED